MVSNPLGSATHTLETTALMDSQPTGRIGSARRNPCLIPLCAQLPKTAMGLTQYFTVRSLRPPAVDAPTSWYRAQVQVWPDVPHSIMWQTKFKTHINYKFKQFEKKKSMHYLYSISCHLRDAGR